MPAPGSTILLITWDGAASAADLVGRLAAGDAGGR